MERKDEFNAGQEQAELADFERRLRGAMQHREAPPWLKQRVLAQARNSAQGRKRALAQQGGWMLQRIAALGVLAAVLGGVAVYRQMEVQAIEQQKAEAARDQVMLALRITSRALNRVGERVNEPGNERGGERSGERVFGRPD